MSRVPGGLRGGEHEPGLRSTGAARELLAALASDARRLGPAVGVFLRVMPRLIKTLLAGVILLGLLLAGAILWALYQAPFDARARTGAPSILAEAANGEPLGRVGPLADAVRRQDFPKALVDAVLSIEDRRFYAHWGIDPWGIARALLANWSAGDIVEGGSTMTQQLAKNEIVGSERTLRRKLREALVALWLDFRLGKDEVLTRYLNGVYLGGGAYGMSAAARMFFDKSLSQLSVAECAMLAGLIQAPARYDLVRNLDAARRRAAVVLEAMVEAGALDALAAAKAKAEPATPRLSAKSPVPAEAPSLRSRKPSGPRIFYDD